MDELTYLCAAEKALGHLTIMFDHESWGVRITGPDGCSWIARGHTVGLAVRHLVGNSLKYHGPNLALEALL